MYISTKPTLDFPKHFVSFKFVSQSTHKKAKM